VNELLLRLDGVGKRYPKVHRNADRLRNLWRLLRGADYSSGQVNTVLQDVSLQILRGQSLGVIGENGAGKSTLLKLITGVLAPTSGSVVVNGTMGGLIELGAGFQPDYTGLENIALSGALLGFSAEELRRKTPEIIEFAELGRYIDEPIKHYSSGMVVRLGFAILATRRPDLLITDEVLAVGDESFQKKCIRWIENYLHDGGTLILVAHSMYHVQKLCSHALWLRDGRVERYGEVFAVTQDYLAYHERKQAASKPELSRGESGLYALQRLTLNGQDVGATNTCEIGSDLLIEADIFTPDGRIPQFFFGIVRADGTPVYGVGSHLEKALPRSQSGDSVNYCVVLNQHALLPGQYVLRAHAMDPEGLRLFDTVTLDFTVRGATQELGLVRLSHHW
jgi:lipopolysaccharide transport system ATP-binding protein